MKQKQVYIGATSPLENKGEFPKDYLIIAKDITEVENIIPEGNKLNRLILTQDWLLIGDNYKDSDGNFYIVDTVHEGIDQGGDNTLYLVRGTSFKEIEEIVKKEVGESFYFIKSIDGSPYEVLGV